MNGRATSVSGTTNASATIVPSVNRYIPGDHRGSQLLSLFFQPPLI